MSLQDLNIDELTEARRESIEKTIHPMEITELKALGESLFPSSEHPWRVTFFKFLDENASATFHHAITHDRVHIIYCHGQDKGMWFLPGSGAGPLQAKGRAILKKIVSFKG